MKDGHLFKITIKLNDVILCYFIKYFFNNIISRKCKFIINYKQLKYNNQIYY